jgi:RNA polymerase sigma-70 factor (ECF subfamily)
MRVPDCEFVVVMPRECNDLASRYTSSVDDETELVRRFAPRARLYGLRHLRSPAAADDLVQTVMVILLEAVRAGTLREPEHVASFVLGTCRHVVGGWHRGEARRRGLLDRFAGDLEPAATDAPSLDRERLAACLGALPPREQLVVTLTFYEDRGADEIAAALAMTPGNVRVVRHRALGHLADCLGAEA